MSTGTEPDGPHALPGDHQLTSKEHARLATGAVGLVGVLFMAIANAAPITAMTFNVPIAIGYGNGIGVAGGFLFATIVLTIFAIGFAAMSKYITTTGAFYGFISQGLGQIPGMVSGILATFCYMIFEASLLGGFAYFAKLYFFDPAGISVSWVVLAVIGAIVIGVFGYFKITIAAAVLGVTLVAEVLLLLALGISVLIKGGPDGFMTAEVLSPLAAFTDLPEGAFGTGVASGVAAIGVFFAFWSWVGFETTAVYGEESRDPKRVVPRATIIAVVGLGLFYTFISWMVVVGNGAAAVVETAAGASPADMFLNLTTSNLGSAFTIVYKLLVVIGSFACAMAFQNAAPRYIYALGRESASPFLRRTIGSVHKKHGSPANAGMVQAVVTILILLYFFQFVSMTSADGTPTPDLVPYVYVYGLLAVVGTAVILILQTMTSAAVISFFWIKKVHKGNVITTLICPIVGGLGMVYVLILLWQNRAFALGAAAESWIWTWAPYYILAMIVLGIGYSMWVKKSHPEIYDEIGRTVHEEAHERV